MKIEQKFADKVEPKFHKGEWVVNKFGDIWHIDGFDSKNYQVSNGDKYCYFPIKKQNEMHLWTIEDAKDGDVLVTISERPFIYKGCLDPVHLNSPVAYCGIIIEGYFQPSYCTDFWWTNEEVHPATKEQRNLLFAKMKEAGYTFDFEKKELKLLITNGGDVNAEKVVSEKDALLSLDTVRNEIIDKACEWLKNDMLKNNAFYGRLERTKIIDGIIDNFRKAMEE